MPIRIIRPKEAAQRLSVSIPTLYRRMKEDDFPPKVKIGNVTGFREQDLDAYINSYLEEKETVTK